MAEGYYVTVTKGKVTHRNTFSPQQTSLVAGPFGRHEEAAGKIDTVFKHFLKTFEEARSWSYGTILFRSKKGQPLPLGRLNERLGFTPTVPV